MIIQLFDAKSLRNIAASVAIFLFFGGLKLSAQGVTVYNTGNSGLPENSVWAVATAPDGKIWFGTDWGLTSFDGTNWVLYQTTNSGLPNDAIKSVLVDDSNHVWVGTSIGGLAKFDGNNWTVYNSGNSPLPADEVRCLAKDSEGSIYMGTEDGVAKLANGSWKTWNLMTLGVGSNNIPAICVTGVDSFWVGTVNGGLVHIEDTTLTKFTIANSGIRDNTQVGIAEDSGDDLWIATPANGLTYYQNLVFLTYNSTNSGNPTLSHSCVVLDQNEAKWAGSLDHGVVYYDSPTWLHFEPSNSGVPQNYVRCLAFDAATGYIWGGTEQSGAFRMEPSILLAAAEEHLAASFSVFPNPTSDWMRWTGDLKHLTIQDLNGRVVLEPSVAAGSVDVSGLPAGIYLVRAEGRFESAVARLVVAH